MDRQKYAETIQKLDEALNILEEQVDQQRKQNDKLMAAEIKSRKQHEAFTLEKVEDLQEKLSLGITTLQQAVGGVTTQFEKEIKQVTRCVYIQGVGRGVSMINFNKYQDKEVWSSLILTVSEPWLQMNDLIKQNLG